METKQAATLIVEEYYRMTDELFNKLLYNGNALNRFSISNRILIKKQMDNASDLRSIDEWQLLGRSVINRALGISVLSPVLNEYYIDTDTGRRIRSNELSNLEIVKALELGIITKNTDVDDVQINTLYDISNTKGEKVEYNANSIDLKRVTNTFKKLLGVNIEINSDIETIMAAYINSLDIKLSSSAIELLQNSLLFSLESFMNNKESKGIDYIDIDINELAIVISCIDSLNAMLVSTISGVKSADAEHTITMIKKAKTLLAIIEANSLYRRINK